MEKMTQKEMFGVLSDYFKGNEVVIPATIARKNESVTLEVTSEDIVTFLNGRIEVLNNKTNGSKTPTKGQVENDKVKEMLIAELAKVGNPITISDLLTQSEVIANYVLENGKHLSNQKISALFTQLVAENKIVNTKDKKKSYFSVV